VLRQWERWINHCLVGPMLKHYYQAALCQFVFTSCLRLPWQPLPKCAIAHGEGTMACTPHEPPRDLVLLAVGANGVAQRPALYSSPKLLLKFLLFATQSYRREVDHFARPAPPGDLQNYLL
jgi:hypothetical protein